MANIGIVGYGFVGEAVKFGFDNSKHKIFIYDKFKPSLSLNDVITNSEFVFVCLPTPYKDNKIDLSIIEDFLKDIYQLIKNTNKILIIKSTVIPGTVKKLTNLFPGCNFCSNPEFLTERNYLQDFINPDRIIIGADDEKIRQRVSDLYKKEFPLIPIFLTDSTSSEMAKYMSNSFLAMKVVFANEIFDLCKKLNINYQDVKNMVIADKRIGNSHLDISPERGFGGKCFPKDLVALIGLFEEMNIDASLLKTVWEKNLQIRKIKDWEKIPFVKTE